jgi:hypothetical protein
MNEQTSQPTCGFLGSTVRADRITTVDRDLTPRLAETETGLFHLQPGLTVDAVREQAPPTKDPADKERYLDALRKVGLQE